MGSKILSCCLVAMLLALQLGLAGCSRTADVEGEAYVILKSGNVLPAAGETIYAIPVEAMSQLRPSVLGELVWRDEAAFGGLSEASLQSALESYDALFRRAVEAHFEAGSVYINEPLRATFYYDDYLAQWKTIEVLRSYLEGDLASVFDPDLAAVVAAGEPGGRWLFESEKTDRSVTLDYMLKRMKLLVSLAKPSTHASCAAVKTEAEDLAAKSAIFQAAQDSGVQAVVAIDGSFSLVLPSRGEYAFFGAYRSEKNRGYWYKEIGVDDLKDGEKIVLNNECFYPFTDGV